MPLRFLCCVVNLTKYVRLRGAKKSQGTPLLSRNLAARYLGDGPKLVRELFRVADEMSPTLVFIDEIDAVGSKRYDSNSGGTREIQRTMLELLNQLDGFDERGDVKVRFVGLGWCGS